MSKPRIRLHLVAKSARPLAALSRAEKVAQAIGFLRSRNRYVLDAGSVRPSWGLAHQTQEESPLMKEIMAADRRRK